jgi:uncharacterized Zn finger protein (UPF0148 family)
MEILSMSCNKCGAPLQVPTGTNFVTCTYCKSALAIHRTGNAAYTEVLAGIDRKTDQILEHVEAIGKQVDQTGMMYELCEISWRLGKTRNFLESSPLIFFAQATGARGSYEAGTSPPTRYDSQSIGSGRVVPKQHAQAVAALNQLIETLSRDSWELYESGPLWFHHKFRRRFR